MKTDFPFPFPRTSGKSVKGVLRCLYLCANTQQSSHMTDEHNTGNWDSPAWQGSFILFSAQKTTPKTICSSKQPKSQGL